MAIQRWTARDLAGYKDYSNANYGDFMNAHACHPFDDTETDPETVSRLAGSIGETVIAPVSGNYYLVGAADNFGNADLGRNNDYTNNIAFSLAGLGSDTGASSGNMYFDAGDTIRIAAGFRSDAARSGCDTRRCVIA